jgi:hypothetical protein
VPWQLRQPAAAAERQANLQVWQLQDLVKVVYMWVQSPSETSMKMEPWMPVIPL